LDTATQRQLDRGRRMVELLKQPQYSPYSFEKQIISIFAGTQGLLDSLPVEQVLPFEEALLRHVDDEFPEIFEELDKTGVINDDLNAKLKEVINNFKANYGQSHG
jgi:F-type H+-transporting ATPase subunit alpha